MRGRAIEHPFDFRFTETKGLAQTKPAVIVKIFWNLVDPLVHNAPERVSFKKFLATWEAR